MVFTLTDRLSSQLGVSTGGDGNGGDVDGDDNDDFPVCITSH